MESTQGCKLEDESAEQWMAIATAYATSICVKNWIKIKAAENRSVLTLWWQGVECIANKTVLFVKKLKVPGEPHLFDSQMTEMFLFFKKKNEGHYSPALFLSF